MKEGQYKKNLFAEALQQYLGYAKNFKELLTRSGRLNVLERCSTII